MLALTSTLTPAVVLGGGARRALPSSPAPSGRIIADPFASYLEDALDRLLPHRRIRHPERPADGAALPVEPEPESRGLPGAASSTDRVPHGTVGGYTNHRCRCRPCRAAHTEACRQRRLARASRPVPEELHGTMNCYTNYGCRCDLCREAKTIDEAERRLRRAGVLG